MSDRPIDTSPAIAKAAKGITQTQALITGELSHADRFEQGIVQFLADQMSNATAWRVDAAFGVFGSLPLVGVTFDDAFVLVDSTNGTVDGPFDLDSPLDATVLLESHPSYNAGSTVRFRLMWGCEGTMTAIWNPNPPDPTFVPIPPPATAPPGTPPGRPSTWVCFTFPVPLRCVCSHDEWWWCPTPCPAVPGLPTVVRARIRCETAGACPATTPATGTPLPTPPWACSDTFWY